MDPTQQLNDLSNYKKQQLLKTLGVQNNSPVEHITLATTFMLHLLDKNEIWLISKPTAVDDYRFEAAKIEGF